MQPISFKRHRFPPEVIRYPVWLYYRFTLSLRDVEEPLAQRRIVVSRGAIRMGATAGEGKSDCVEVCPYDVFDVTRLRYLKEVPPAPGDEGRHRQQDDVDG